MTFDLKRARELVWAASERRIWTPPGGTGYGLDIDKHREWQAVVEICDKQFPSALDEIERLRAEAEEAQESLTAAYLLGSHEKAHEQAAKIKELEAEIGRLRDENAFLEKVIHKKNIGLNELEDALEADAEQSEICIQARLDVIDQQAAKIRELEANCIYDPETGKVFVPDGHPELEKLRVRNRDLEDALVERSAIVMFLQEAWGSTIQFRAAKAQMGEWKRLPEDFKESWRKGARKQLQAEGKIGPDADAKPQSWQITEERKAALNSILEYISYDSHDDIEICGHADILRAMLRGAE